MNIMLKGFTKLLLLLLLVFTSFSLQAKPVDWRTTTFDDKEHFLKYMSACILEVNKKLPREQKVSDELMVAQAVLESAWGTSRFALEGNNLYGIKTWTRTGPNMLPLENQKAKFSVRVFMTKCDSVKEYVRILNNHPAHKDFRTKRLETKNAIYLAPFLQNYSELGDEYTKRLVSVILYIRKHYDIS